MLLSQSGADNQPPLFLVLLECSYVLFIDAFALQWQSWLVVILYGLHMTHFFDMTHAM